MSRRGHGSIKVPRVKLRPAQIQQGASVNNATGAGIAKEPEADEEDFSLRQELQGENKPLDGIVVCITGIKEERSELQGIALSLGGRVQQALTADVTHLIAESTSTPKYKCAVEYGISIMKPAWLFDMREAWLQGDIPDVPTVSRTHRLRPLHGLYISLTGFSSDQDYRKELTSAISAAGATYKPTFVKSCTHLIVGPEFRGHEMALNSPKVVKAQEFAGLHQSYPEEQKHAVQVVWSEWLDDSLALRGALDEAKYSILKPRTLQDRVMAVKSAITDQPQQNSTTSNSNRSPVLSNASTAALVDDSRINPHDLSASRPVSSALFETGPPESSSHKRALGSNASNSGLRKKQRVSSGSSRAVSGLLNLEDEEEGEVMPVKQSSTPASASQATSRSLKPERSLSQLAPPRPPTASSSSSQLGKLTSKSSFKSCSQSVKSQPFVANNFSLRHPAGSRSSTPVPPKSSSPRKLRVAAPPENGEDAGFFEGLRFALCDLEPKHVETAQTVIQQCGGQVIRTAATLQQALSDDVDFMITKFLHSSNANIDLQHPKLIAQSWLEKCLSTEGFVEPDSFWAGRPIRLDSSKSYLDLKLALPSKSLEEYDRFALERICRNLEIPFRSEISPGWTTHALVTSPADMGSVSDASVDLTVLSVSQFPALLQSGSNDPSSPSTGPEGILQGCIISLSKKVNSTSERRDVVDRISKLGAGISSGSGPEVTHLIHLGDVRGQDIKAAQARGVLVVHPLWLEECQRLESHALERAFPPTFQPGSALSFGSMPASTAPSRMQRQGSKTNGLPLGQQADQSLANDSIATANTSADDLPSPVNIGANAQRGVNTKHFPKAQSQPPGRALSNQHSAPLVDEEAAKENGPHPADRSFDRIVPSNVLDSSPMLRPGEKKAALVKSKSLEATAADLRQRPSEQPASNSHILSGLKSLFDTYGKEDVEEQSRPRKQRRIVLGRQVSSPSVAERSDDSDAFAPSDYIQPQGRQAGFSAGQKRVRSAFEMTQLQGTQAEETPNEEQSMRITVVDPAAREAKLRLLGKTISPVKEIDPSSGDDFMMIPESSSSTIRRSGRTRKYREERI